MSALGDELAQKNQEAVAGAKLVVFVDATPVTDAEPTYSVRLEAPSFSEVLLTDQSAAEVADALAEFTAWAAATW